MAFPPLLALPSHAHGADDVVSQTRSDAPHLRASAPHTLDASLWARLEAMQVDPPDASTTFAERLARENGWSLALAEAVIAEYRRFLYLAARAGHPVSPSAAVDKAWHLHLTYTRHYWDVLCGELLGFELHHDPTLGGAREAAKHADWYRRTLQSYRAAFGDAPPAAIWPGGKAPRVQGVERSWRGVLGATRTMPKLAIVLLVVVALLVLWQVRPSWAFMGFIVLVGWFLPAGGRSGSGLYGGSCAYGGGGSCGSGCGGGGCGGGGCGGSS
jgi:hypothetical protein